MAYVPNRTTYKLVFEDPAYDGLEVSAYAGSIGQYLDIAKLADLDLTPPYSAEDLEPVFALFEAFAGKPADDRGPAAKGVLVSWNIEQPKGRKVPATVAGLRSLEITLAMAIINAWMNAVAGTALPLDATDLELPVQPLGS